METYETLQVGARTTCGTTLAVRAAMHDVADFTLRITVMAPERAPERAIDDYAQTQPFARPNGLPGVTGRPASRPQAPQQPPRPMPQRLLAVAPVTPKAAPSAPTLQPDAPTVMAPSIPSPTLESALLRVKARGTIELPPPPAPRASPLSDDEERRVVRRAHAHRKIAWARNLLRRFHFEDRT